MPIVLGAFVPHPPVLVPNIGKENCDLFAATNSAYTTLKEHIAQKEIDTLIIISPHGAQRNQSGFRLHVPQSYKGDFKEFGDLATTVEAQSDVILGQAIKDHFLHHDMNVYYDSSAELDYGASIPLLFLAPSSAQKILVLNPSTLGLAEHFELGKELHEVLQSSSRRVGVIASGDLSHTIGDDAPGGYSPAAKQFDRAFLACLQKKKSKKITKIDPELIASVGSCGAEVASILLGILEKMHSVPELLSYEHPLGVGYCVMEFVI